ncbi:hypothetical protein E8E13_001647 [Curvularia kusanoi]|uniref:Protein-S-isoprenylcysteine O-methyltransferase n=1 Tax=Curvularia kusanoi TaxID=90978 RepID=A0A9P4W831_CURKU|nr:hypothetical protein E8E13_001647 [Curvularia kusanoi]
MDIQAILYAAAILHAGYLIQLAFRQPNTRVISTKIESWPMWIAASPIGTMIARFITLAIAAHHATVALSLSNTLPHSNEVLQTVCPTPQYMNTQLFTWSQSTVVALALLYVGIYVRLQAYAQLGTNFTYRIAKPDELVTSGFYAYVRHPSYTGLFVVLVAFYSLFIQQRGLLSCWAPLISEKLVIDEKHAYVLPLVGFSVFISLFMMRRVAEEEEMMEKAFGDRWRQHKARTKKFIPYVY